MSEIEDRLNKARDAIKDNQAKMKKKGNRAANIIAALVIAILILSFSYSANPEPYLSTFEEDGWGGLLQFGAILLAAYFAVGYGIVHAVNSIRRDFGLSSEITNIDLKETQKELEEIKKERRKHPDDLGLASAEATKQLQTYVSINTEQVRSIYRITIWVLVFGLGFISAAIFLSFIRPDDITPAVVAGAGGVITEFLGATFLVVHRSTLEQSRHYIQTLDKSSSVEIAMRILNSIEKNADRKEDAISAKIEVAKLLISKGSE